MKPLRACTRSGCPNLTDRGLCSTCQRALPQRPTAQARGYDSRWAKARKGFLEKHPRCECDQHKGKPDAPPATVVDHIIPHKGDKVVFWTRSNWRAMSAPCHNSKTAREDGGFGHKGRIVSSLPSKEQTVTQDSAVWFV